jgi:hypothetical protein
MNKEIEARYANDKISAEAVASIVAFPLDIPSLERQLWHSYELGDEPFLSDGYCWTDKPHKAMDKAIQEIRALRAHIMKTPTEGTLAKLDEWRNKSDAAMRLSLGECTAQELRTVKAVLNSIAGE